MALRKNLQGQATQEQIAAWKKENPGGVYGIEVDNHIGYFRNPSRRDCNIAASQLDEQNPYDFFETIMRETFLGGSQEIIDNDNLYLGAVQLVKKKIDGAKAKLVNL